ncbi:hypothetical protein BU23DRAFT_374141, partial [Bimuria novae-zelandiae CBS 107.79]
APADEIISYETRTFDHGFGMRRPVYVGTDAAADAAWQDLYEGLEYLTIPSPLASLLLNATSPHPHAPSLSLLGLDVIHQLHCLDALRKFMHLTAYPNMMAMEKWDVHRDHCLDSIWQSLMCSADVSAISFIWDEGRGFTLPDARVTHTCRRWEDVRKW